MATVFLSQFVDKKFYTFVFDPAESADLLDFVLMAEMGTAWMCLASPWCYQASHDPRHRQQNFKNPKNCHPPLGSLIPIRGFDTDNVSLYVIEIIGVGTNVM